MLLWINLTFKVDREWPEFSRLNLIAIVDSFQHPSECCSSVDYQIIFLYIACSQMSTRHHCKAFLAYVESILVEWQGNIGSWHSFTELVFFNRSETSDQLRMGREWGKTYLALPPPVLPFLLLLGRNLFLSLIIPCFEIQHESFCNKTVTFCL